MKKPNLFLIGAPKTGTTALYSYLKPHSKIFMSEHKELNYFCKDIVHAEDSYTLDKYLENFKDADESALYIGEATVFNLYSDEAAPKIKDFSPDAKLIVMVRNPIELAYSFYYQALWSSSENAKTFEEAWQLQEQRRNGKNIPKKFHNHKLTQYKAIALLGEQIERLYKIFPKEQVYVIVYDKFRKDTKSEFLKVLDFLNLEYEDNFSFDIVNASKVHRMKWLVNLIKNRRNEVRILKKIIPVKKFGISNFLDEKLSVEKKRPQLSLETVQMLKKEFESDVKLLESLINEDLSHWYK